ncbi:phosphoribosylanthranilate isomerase [Sinorhizobium medicae]|uniref:N-(5'-phosphoribosyl)anthranilate isomerase n=2 Tax=Sinorhizobium medicae TaxID=110321 RepID=TRPF_SINMW|nr:phosphoribosylanthranilate isomerase [Sinorhizobium medicae]A6UEI0.1 RecName: Full=N-(5'-phosphoribosyl)anthranilate isomerase; Short=PRAI [Sinorhizobium medicae WSM419]ABR62060.1 Phosphoribosylanthranilate isomerase [Sinorhizobium medicae WSM419]MBO1964308.1 phosphoribosylanthranilate isomerase [Sinorhizobium medicae]MDX0404327.1 phosphoribosylanthranilate isomerase [Sinorhizobium medicae]MDX0410264.1 phosphoribosylanthranilate isomerase [Sinorhizobium medicae]MDX0416201.1 phosphoribosyla
MKTEVKICGLKTAEALQRAVALGASHTGFIFFPKSPRNIEPDDAGRLAELARGRAKIVAVTVDADNDDLDEIVSALHPEVLQLHGSENPERVLAIKALYGLPVIKALPIREASDLERIAPYIGIADRFLLDAKPPAGSDLPGGNGVSFDWRLLDALDANVDYMLSGGLNASNVEDALALTGARAIDTSSGVESAPGIKDLTLMDAFFEAIRRAEA